MGKQVKKRKVEFVIEFTISRFKKFLKRCHHTTHSTQRAFERQVDFQAQPVDRFIRLMFDNKRNTYMVYALFDDGTLRVYDYLNERFVTAYITSKYRLSYIFGPHNLHLIPPRALEKIDQNTRESSIIKTENKFRLI